MLPLVSIDTVTNQLKDWLLDKGYDNNHVTPQIVMNALFSVRGCQKRTVDNWLDVLKKSGRLMPNNGRTGDDWRLV